VVKHARSAAAKVLLEADLGLFSWRRNLGWGRHENQRGAGCTRNRRWDTRRAPGAADTRRISIQVIGLLDALWDDIYSPGIRDAAGSAVPRNRPHRRNWGAILRPASVGRHRGAATVGLCGLD